MINEFELAKINLSKKIAGEICLSDNAGKVIQKWRKIMKIPQRQLADEIKVMPSVISDYESGRRRSPGIKMIKKVVDGLIRIDEMAGGKIIREFSNFPEHKPISSAVFDIREFVNPVHIKNFVKVIDAKLINNVENHDIYGYTIIDSLKAIVNFSPIQLVQLYGATTERALIFTKVEYGRSPLVAIKVTSLRPGLIVLHGTKHVDEIAKRIAEVEQIPLALSKNISVDEMIKKLRKSFN